HRPKVIIYFMTNGTYASCTGFVNCKHSKNINLLGIKEITMFQLHSYLLVLHILLGCIALVLFWVPVFTAKGQLNHKKFGKYYTNTMYSVAATGAIMAIMVLIAPLYFKQHIAPNADPENLATSVRTFWWFLLYLAVLSYVGTKHGFEVLKVRENRHLLKRVTYVLPVAVLLLGGIVLFVSGVSRSHVLHSIFGILGTLVALGTFKYIYAKSVSKNRYITEHIGSMIGSAIGAYTAFLAFGGRTLLEGIGSYQIIFWIAPGVIGSAASYILCKKYAKVFAIQ
ncbi:MAG: hypothetical protein WA981_12970, partial [Glaciecola sp.]